MNLSAPYSVLTKYDKEGEVIWQKVFGSPKGSLELVALSPAEKGSFYAVGFGKAIEDIKVKGWYDGAIYKIDKNGKIDCVVIDGEVAKALVEANEGLEIIADAYSIEEYAIAIAKENTELLEKIKAGEHYDFVEMMACPGGCIHGGGTPIVSATDRSYVDVKAERAKALYAEDAGKAKRKSHENEEVKKLYAEYLGEIGGHKAHELLHTHYTARKKYN